MEQNEIINEFLIRYGINLNNYINVEDTDDQNPIERIFNRQRYVLEAYCRTFNTTLKYESLNDTNKEKINELVLEQMYYVLNNFDFTTLAGFDMGLNSSLPLSEITNRYISPIVKEELKNSNFLYRGIY